MVQGLERQRERVTAAAGEVVDRPAVPENLRRPRQRLRAAAGEDDLIGSAAGGELLLRQRGDLRRPARIGAQAAGEGDAVADGVAADDPGARALEQLDEETADRSETDDDRRVAGLDPGPPHGAQTARQRLDERRRLVPHVRRNTEHRVTDVGGRDTHVFGESAGVEVRRLERGAHRLAAAAAIVTVAARNMVGRHDAVADRAARYAGADGRHLAYHLVTQDHRDLRRRIDDLADVRPAETAAREAQQDLAIADRGRGPVFGGEPAAPAIDRGLHAARPRREAEPNRAAAQQRNAIATLRPYLRRIASPRAMSP